MQTNKQQQTATNVQNVQEEVLNFINPTYKFNFRLPYCQWDVRDVMVVKVNDEKTPLESRYRATIVEMKKRAQAQNLESYGYGMILTATQAEMCGFRPGRHWQEGYVMLGSTSTHCFYNPHPLVTIIKPFEKVYRERMINDEGREVAGMQYYPKPNEKIDSSKYIIYVKYLIALLDRNESGQIELLHETPLSFSPRSKSGIVLRNEIYEPFKSVVASSYGNQVAPFIFALQLNQACENWAQNKDKSKSTDVMRMVYNLPHNKEELNSYFVGSEIGKKLESWFAYYNAKNPVLEETTGETETEPETFSANHGEYNPEPPNGKYGF